MNTFHNLCPALMLAVLLLAGCSDRSNQDATPAAPFVIQPHVSVGKICAGMNLDQVRAELGDPQAKTSNAWEYTRLGFAVMHGPDNVVQVVMCGDVTGLAGPLVARFNGKTPEGIGLTASRDEVIKAYGEPSHAEQFPGHRESMRYDALGITFSLEAGKVHHMIVRLTPTETNQEPAKAIQVVP